jgi:lipopolysaccharide export system protein LptC
MASDRYSRLISWLKVLFPLAALAILSTLFLLSRAIDPDAQIPFADKEIQDRLRDQQVTGPFFTGTTADGDQIMFSAEKLTTPEGQTGSNEAENIKTVVDLAQGDTVTLTAQRARFDLARDHAELTGEVLITTTSGYRVTSDLLTSAISSLSVNSPGRVSGETPAGTLDAGSMTLSVPQKGAGAQLVFTNGVKLVYTPQQSKK